ncbi:MAG: hypothetical protein ABL986_10900 [Vicinamibacterales bacterium]
MFAASRVNRLDIDVSSADWQTLMTDMAAMAGAFGAQRTPTQPPGQGGGAGQGNVIVIAPSPDAIAACSGKVVADACTLPDVTASRCAQVGPATLACVGIPAGGGGNVGGVVGGGNAPAGGLGGNGRRGANGADDVDIFPRTPVYIPADVRFDGQVFHHVGFRLKGNSSLSNAWRSGVDKLPFRLNFDELEDRFPEIRDQTFFGFSNLSFTSNGTDVSLFAAPCRHRRTLDAILPAVVSQEDQPGR